MTDDQFKIILFVLKQMEFHLRHMAVHSEKMSEALQAEVKELRIPS